MQGFVPDSAWHKPTDKLTDREKEVLVKIAEGPSAKEAALKLHVALPTVKSHRVSIYSKLNLHSIPALVDYAIREGFGSTLVA